MAPSGGYHIVPKAVRAVKYAISRSSDFVRARLGSATGTSLEAGAAPAFARIATSSSRHALHPLAVLRQSRARQTRLFSTAITSLGRLAGRSTAPLTVRAAAFPASATRAALGRTTHAPFAAPLRPNLTGGALPRSAGGYGLGGGGFGAARHFSHTGSAQAHVVQNVHAAVRAFVLQGGRPLYDGTDKHTGAMRFRAAGTAEAAAHQALSQSKKPWAEMRGTSLDFPLAPAITALSTASGPTATLDEPHVLPGLASDFARQLRELAAVYADLKKLRSLGALPVFQADATTLRVRFDGCDADAVLALCDELGVTRGIIKEDPGWDGDEVEESHVESSHRHDRDVAMALLFPWAPTEHCASETSSFDDDYGGERYFTHPHHPAHAPQAAPRKRHFEPSTALEWRSMLSGSIPRSTADSPSFAFVNEEGTASDPFEFESIGASSDEHGQQHPLHPPPVVPTTPAAATGYEGYEGVEGIYRFLRELESADRRA